MKTIFHQSSALRKPALYLYACVVGICIAAGALYFHNERAAKLQYAATDADTSLIVRAVGDSDHVIGRRNAPIQLIVYSDLSCPYCNNFFARTLPMLQAKYGDHIVIAYRHLPLEAIHPRALREAEASECSAILGGEEAFWKFERAVYDNPDFERGLDDAALTNIAKMIGLAVSRFDQCLASGEALSRIRNDMTEAAVAGLNYTPSTVLKSAHRATIVKGSAYPRFTSAIDYLMRVEKEISER